MYSFLCLFFLVGFVFFGFLPIQKYPKNSMDYYFLALLLAVGLTAGFIVYKQWKKCRGFDFIFVIFILLGAILRFYPIDLFSIWLDEATQFIGTYQSGVITYSKYQQQMPLDYLYSGISHYLFGAKEWAPRLFPFIFGSLSCGFFYLLAKRYISSNSLLFLASTFFCCSPWLIRYSVEGRPLSLAVLAGIFFLIVLSEVYEAKELSSLQRFFSVFTVSLFLLGATFFQNFIFLLAANVGLFLCFRPKPKAFFWIVAPQVSALLLWGPIIYELLDFSLKFKLNSLSWNDLFSSTNKKYTFLEVLESTWITQLEYLFLCLPLAVLGVVWALLRKKKLHDGWVLSAGLLISFIATFTVSYFILVNWEIYHRYSLMLLPVYALFVFSTLDHWMTFSSKKSVKGLMILVGVVSLALSLKTLYGYYTLEIDLEKHTNWREMYKTIKEQGRPGDIILGAMYDNYGFWNAPGLLCSHFYLENDGGFHFPKMHEGPTQVYFLRELLKKESQFNPYSVFMIHIWSNEYSSEDLPAGIVLIKQPSMAILSLELKDQPWPEALLRLIDVSMGMREKGVALTFLKLKLEILLHRGRLQEAATVLAELIDYGVKEQEPELYDYYKSLL